MENTLRSVVDAREAEPLWREFRASRSFEARNALIEMYLPLCQRMAKTLFSRRGGLSAEYLEYVQMATLGLIDAIETFDTCRGTMFEVFALRRIRGAVLDGLRSLSEKHEQVNLQRRLQRHRVTSLMEREEGAAADHKHDDLFEHLARVTMGIAIGYMLDGTNLLIDAKASQEPRREFYDSIEMSERRDMTRKIVESLPAQHRRVLRYHYFHGLSFTDTAELLGLTKGRVSQIHRQALEMLRERVKNRGGVLF